MTTKEGSEQRKAAYIKEVGIGTRFAMRPPKDTAKP